MTKIFTIIFPSCGFAYSFIAKSKSTTAAALRSSLFSRQHLLYFFYIHFFVCVMKAIISGRNMANKCSLGTLLYDYDDDPIGMCSHLIIHTIWHAFSLGSRFSISIHSVDEEMHVSSLLTIFEHTRVTQKICSLLCLHNKAAEWWCRKLKFRFSDILSFLFLIVIESSHVSNCQRCVLLSWYLLNVCVSLYIC